MNRQAQIAVVDDDRGVREAVEGLILSLGYSVLTFGSAADFLALPDRAAVDCVILDIKMPGMSGLELQDILNREAPGLPIIFLSSYADGSVYRRASEGGASCVLAKPVNDTVLIACIEAALASA